MSLVEQIDFLFFTGALEGKGLIIMYNLLKSYEQGWLTHAEMQNEINSFHPDFYLGAW
jgi:hypothetical protein